MAARLLDQRALNRALLARRLLLEPRRGALAGAPGLPAGLVALDDRDPREGRKRWLRYQQGDPSARERVAAARRVAGRLEPGEA